MKNTKTDIETKIVINCCYGGFGLSEEGLKMYKKLKGLPENSNLYDDEIPRYDKDLVKVVEILGEKADSNYAKLEIVTIKGIKYNINEYDGFESIITPDIMVWDIIDTTESREMYPEYFV
jgi:hypothetical protein